MTFALLAATAVAAAALPAMGAADLGVRPAAPAAADYSLPPGPIEFGLGETPACLGCHGLPGFFVADSTTGRVRLLTVDADAFLASAHAKVGCNHCHVEIARYPHALSEGRARVSCDAQCHATDANGRPYRHATQAAEFARSVHRRGVAGEDPASPDCAYCHGGGDPHAVPPKPKTQARAARAARCEVCHDDRPLMRALDVDPEAVASWRESFHARSIRFGSTRAATCQDCHGVHLVLAPTDTASTVHPSHLAATCGQQDCHRGAQVRFAMSGANHLAIRMRREPVLAATAILFAGIGTFVVLLLSAAVALDAARRIGRPAPLPAAGLSASAPLVPRLSLAQRLQHFALVAAFIVLVVTGLPLRFPDSEVLAALYRAIGGLRGARAAHHGAGALLAAAGLAHGVYALVLLVRARFDLRRAWPMLPTRQDIRDARALTGYQLRLRSEPPTFDRHTFRSKIHYFAVLFGLPVMVASGFVLGFPVAIGNHLPDVAIGMAHLAHRDEALAAIAIVAVWHLYLVHVAPRPHHRFLTWIDGRITRGRWLAEHGREAARTRETP